MTRKKSHFQDKEPLFEGLLQNLRFPKIKPYILNRSKVLDLGCGYNAPLLRFFEDKISEGVGVDISVNKKGSTKKVTLLSRRLDKPLKMVKNHFDLVTSLAVSEHLNNPLVMYKTAYKALKPGGKFVLTTPSPTAKPILEFLSYRLGLISKQEIADHKKYYSISEIKNLLKTAGFKTRRIEISLFLFGLNTFAVAKK